MMRRPDFVILSMLCMCLYAGTVAADSCQLLAERVRSGMQIAWLSKEPASALSLLRQETKDALQADCAASADAAYADLRMQELGAGESFPVGLLTPDQEQALQTQAAAYHARFPASAPIATVLARIQRTPEAARLALALDPRYPPAHAALAEALLLAGQWEEARAELKQVPDLSVLSDGFSLLARIHLARGDLAGAIQAANQALHKRQISSLLEPDASSLLPICQANEVLGLAYLQQHKYGLAARALRAASPCSQRAAALLAEPPEGLRQALQGADRRSRQAK